MRWPARSGSLRVQVGRDSIRAVADHRGRVTWAGEAGYTSLEDLADAIARLAAEPAQHCRHLEVALERPLVQLRSLRDLPPVKERELARLVAHQAGRFFRKNGTPLVTDAVWVKNGTDRVVHAAAVEEPVVEAIVAGARGAGLMILSIAPAERDGLLLLPTSERATRARAERRLLRRLAIGTVGMWTLVAGLFVGRVVWERREVERQLQALQAPIAAVLAARQELRDADATLTAINNADHTRGEGMAILGAVVAALPDSAVLTSLTWYSDQASLLTGVARRAGDVLAQLERSQAVAMPRFEGAVVRETFAGRDWERYTIRFDQRVAP